MLKIQLEIETGKLQKAVGILLVIRVINLFGKKMILPEFMHGTPEIIPSIGPEGFDGLPGTILGLATEDGGVVYFAKIIEEKFQNIDEITSDIKIKNFYTEQELKDELIKKSKSNPWMGRVVNYLFDW